MEALNEDPNSFRFETASNISDFSKILDEKFIENSRILEDKLPENSRILEENLEKKLVENSRYGNMGRKINGEPERYRRASRRNE